MKRPRPPPHKEGRSGAAHEKEKAWVLAPTCHWLNSTHCIILMKVPKLSKPAFFHLELEIPIPILSAFDGH